MSSKHTSSDDEPWGFIIEPPEESNKKIPFTDLVDYVCADPPRPFPWYHALECIEVGIEGSDMEVINAYEFGDTQGILQLVSEVLELDLGQFQTMYNIVQQIGLATQHPWLQHMCGAMIRIRFALALTLDSPVDEATRRGCTRLLQAYKMLGAIVILHPGFQYRLFQSDTVYAGDWFQGCIEEAGTDFEDVIAANEDTHRQLTQGALQVLGGDRAVELLQVIERETNLL